MRLGPLGGVVGMVVLLACASPSPAPVANQRPSADQLEALEPEDSYAHFLSPAERQALAAQGYDLEIDDTTELAESSASDRDDGERREPKGRVGRAMDHAGRALVSVASVALTVGAAIAPFFLF